MQDVLSLYPRFLVFSGIMAAFLMLLALIPASGPADATAINTPVQTTASDASTKISPSDCRIDQHAYSPSCQMQGRTVRVINF